MKISKEDIAHSRNMLKALGKGEWKLDGMEIMAFAAMMQWFSGLQKVMEVEFAKDQAEAQKPPMEVKKEVEPVKTIDPPKPPQKVKK